MPTSSQELTVAERDRQALAHIKIARSAIDAALQAMPNHVESAFSTFTDTARLSGVRRDLVLLELVEDEIDARHGAACTCPASVRAGGRHSTTCPARG